MSLLKSLGLSTKTITKFVIVLNLLISSIPAYTQNKEFNIEIDKTTGGLNQIQNTKDTSRMNWILRSDGSQYPWQTSEYAWGLGFVNVINGNEAKLYKWKDLTASHHSDNKSVYEYQLADIKVSVTRTYDANGYFVESYSFTNTSKTNVKLNGIGIYTPMNDNYVTAKVCIHSRCNAHVWAGNNASYINSIRMGGTAPHLGLVVIQGNIAGYEIINVVHDNKWNGSDNRGGITLNPADVVLKPGESSRIVWKLFWHKGWDDFLTKAKQLGFVQASAEKYVLQQGEKNTIHFSSSKKLSNVYLTVNNKPVGFKQNGNEITATIKSEELGDNVVKLSYGNSFTVCNILVLSSFEQMIKNRVNFIVNNQQLNDKSDPRYGAYMVYDNETNSIYKKNILNLPSPADKDEGDERIGMGTMIARRLEQNHDADTMVMNSLLKYYSFLRTKLQTPDYKYTSQIDQKGRHRGYIWLASYYSELYALTHDKKYIMDAYKTLRRFYKEYNNGGYSMGLSVIRSVELLKKANLYAEADTMMQAYIKDGEVFMKNGIYLKRGEVSYEQGRVAQSCIFFTEMYLLTKNNEYLIEAKKHLLPLEAFDGLQPDFHLNQIGLRHWDGYWFGKKPTWGDTMPHYWSALSGRAYLLYYKATGDKRYLEKGKTCLTAQLSNFTDDGRGSCAYIYPNKVNGKNGKFYDSFANDQDWGMFYYLEMQDLLKVN
jgi:hypothetical protein